MQSLKDDEYDYNEVNSILNRYLKQYGISYTESAIADDQSLIQQNDLISTPVGSAFQPIQSTNIKANEVTVLHDTQRSGPAGSSTDVADVPDNLTRSQLIELDPTPQAPPSQKHSINTDAKLDIRTVHEPSISVLEKDINTLEQRMFKSMKGSQEQGNIPKNEDMMINLDDLEDVLTMSDNINESLGKYTHALTKLQSNVQNYGRHTNPANILRNSRGSLGLRRDPGRLYYQGKGRRPLSNVHSSRSSQQSRHRLTSSLPDALLHDSSTSMKTSKSQGANNWSTPAIISRPELPRRSRSQSRHSHSTLEDSLLDCSLDLDTRTMGINRGVDTNEIISKVVINGHLTSIEARTLFGRLHTLELMLDQSYCTIKELRRENSRLNRVLAARDASTQKIMTLETEVIALQKSLRQSEESRRRQAILLDKLKAEQDV